MEKAGDGLAPPAALTIDVSAPMENQMTNEELVARIEKLEAELKALRQDAADADQTIVSAVNDLEHRIQNPRYAKSIRVVRTNASAWSDKLSFR